MWVSSVTCSEEPEDDEDLKVPVLKAAEEINGCCTEAQDGVPFSTCTQGDADPHNLEVNEQTSKVQEPCPSEEKPVSTPDQAAEVKKKMTYAKLLKEGRRFNIDLVSKVSVRLLKVHTCEARFQCQIMLPVCIELCLCSIVQ